MRLIIIPFDDDYKVIENDILEIESEDLIKISSSLNYLMKNKLYQIEIYKNLKDNLIIQLGNVSAIGSFSYKNQHHKIEFDDSPYEKVIELISKYIRKSGSEEINEIFHFQKEEQKRFDKEKYEKWKINYKPNLKKEKRRNLLTNILVPVFLGIVFLFTYYAWIDDLKFFNKNISETKGVVIETKYYHYSGGYMKQKVTYEFKFNDIYYTNTFNAGRLEGKHSIGDSVLVKFTPKNPNISRRLETLK